LVRAESGKTGQGGQLLTSNLATADGCFAGSNFSLEVTEMLSAKTFGLRKIHFAVIALLLALPLVAVAQVTTATIVGNVSDPGGAIVAGAQVTARNADTDLQR
jgi:hypothetical protein